ncbi:MAG: 4'-phosphopantetheinyl transferase [Flavobacteriales bacterium]|jgi:4'-phosphopantetheinyl transferase
MQTIDLYYYSITQHGLADCADRYLAVMDDAEKQRYKRFLRDKPRYTFGLARYLLKTELAKRLGRSALSLSFDYSENGKPFLKDEPQLCFNLSHCDSAVVFAVADVDVGVDVEPHHRRGDHWQNSSEFINKNVAAYIDDLKADSEKILAFARYWTAMEAYTKLKAARFYEVKEGFCDRGERIVDNAFQAYRDCEIYSLAAPFEDQISLAVSNRAGRELAVRIFQSPIE